MDKPNLLFLMTDQQRWDAMGCSGGWVKTPHLDRIAAEGIRFTHCVTNAPGCIPTRIALATGLYPHNTGVWRNCWYNLPEETPTWTQAIRAAGYRTSVFGKTHLHPGGDLRKKEHRLHRFGFDDVNEIAGPRESTRTLSHMTAHWGEKGVWEAFREDYRERFATRPHLVRPSMLPLEDYPDVYVGQQAKQYLAAYDRPEPWFCWVSFGGPHEPWDAPEPYARWHRPENMPPPLPPLSMPTGRPLGWLDRRLENLPDLTPADVAALRANYAGSVSLIDDQIGQILDVLEQRGDLERTVMVFTSDHGEMNGDYGLLYKGNFLKSAVRVPLLIRTPETAGRRPGETVSDALVEWFDIGPTLVELAGGELQHRQFARSFCPRLADPEGEHRPFAISEFRGEIMIVDDQWKMAINAEGMPYLLFDRVGDPGEHYNRAGTAGAAAVETQRRLHILERLVQTQTRLDVR